MRTHQGAVLIADITGFTALTEDLGRRGALGVELLTRCMNNYFTLIMELVRPFFASLQENSVLLLDQKVRRRSMLKPNL